MSLAYPLAKTVEGALSGAVAAARTRYEAEEAANGQAVDALATEWFKPDPERLSEILAEAEQGPGHGFVQNYEDGDGAPVLAVTYWKIYNKPGKSKPKPAPAASISEELDHTDDLYFKHGRTKKSRRRRKKPDPNQLDLFGKPPEPDG